MEKTYVVRRKNMKEEESGDLIKSAEMKLTDGCLQFLDKTGECWYLIAAGEWTEAAIDIEGNQLL